MPNIRPTASLSQQTGKTTGLVIKNIDNVATTATKTVESAASSTAAIEAATQGMVMVRASLSYLQFRKLFTLQERIKFDNVEFSDSTPKEVKATMATIFKDLQAAPAIELGTPSVTRGVLYMMKVGFITAERGAEILANKAKDV